MLTAFDGRSCWSHGILPSLEVQLGGKNVSIEVEVVDAPLDYKLLLGRKWIYIMKELCLPSSVLFDSISKIGLLGSSRGHSIILVRQNHRDPQSQLLIILSR